MMPSRAAVVLSCLAAAAGAHADDRLVLAGGEVAESSYYSYAGTVLPLGRRNDGRGFLQRYWIDRFGYEYDTGQRRIKASAYGAEAALGYGTSFPQGWATASLGLRYTNTDLTPDDTSAQARGSQVGLKLDVQAEREVAPQWRAGAIASYVTQQNAYWGRVRLMRSLSPGRALGGEIVLGGNSESHSTSAGFVLTIQPQAAPWSIGLRAGYRTQSSGDSAYGGVELGYAF
jgi:hypothetical protein